MFAGEPQRQKAAFAASDSVALLAALAGALMLHGPAGAMEARLLRSDPALLCLNVLAIVFLWVLVFRACDLYRMRNGGLRELAGIARGCSIAALLTILIGFLAHIDVFTDHGDVWLPFEHPGDPAGAHCNSILHSAFLLQSEKRHSAAVYQ
jgi:hypothetical protein